MSTSNAKIAGPGAGVYLVFDGKSRKFRVTEPEISSMITIQGHDADGFGQVRHLSLESYEDMATVNLAGSITVSWVDPTDIDDIAEENGPGEITATIQSVDNKILAAGHVRGPAPTVVDVEGTLTLNHSNGDIREDVPFEGQLHTTSYFKKAWESLDDPDDHTRKFGGASKTASPFQLVKFVELAKMNHKGWMAKIIIKGPLDALTRAGISTDEIRDSHGLYHPKSGRDFNKAMNDKFGDDIGELILYAAFLKIGSRNPGMDVEPELIIEPLGDTRLAFRFPPQIQGDTVILDVQAIVVGQSGEHNFLKGAAKAPSGLYGFKKAVQSNCEAAIRKMSRTAERLAKRAYAKDENVAPFLSTHAKQAKSLPAKILIAAMKTIGPKLASENPDQTRLRELRAKSAGKRQYGLYGFMSKTANLGLAACTELRESAGHVASGLHGRRADMHGDITGFFDQHSKEARCLYSKLLRTSYPASDRKTASESPTTVDEWISWED